MNPRAPRAALALCLAGTVAGTTLAVAATSNGGHLGTAHAGRQSPSTAITSTGQRLTPAGTQVEFPGRPTAIAVRRDGRTAAVLNTKGDFVLVLDLQTGKVLQSVKGGAGSFDGIAYSPKGDRLAASDAGGAVSTFAVATSGTLTLEGTITPPASPPTAQTDINSASSNAYPGGLAFSADGSKVYVAYSVLNQLGVIDIGTRKVTSRIDVGNAPHSVVVSGSTAYVSDEGGRRSTGDDVTNFSDGTPIVADKVHGAASTGRVSVVDLVAGKEITQVATGLHPSSPTRPTSRRTPPCSPRSCRR